MDDPRRRRSPKQMQADCDRFNARFKPGDDIRACSGDKDVDPYKTVQVKHPAEILSGHTPVVYVTGGQGCIALSHVEGWR